MGVARRSLLITYVFSVLMVVLYKFLVSMSSPSEFIQRLLSDQRMFYIVILLPILPSIVSYIIIRILENDLSRKLNLYNESLYKIRNIIDAYAFVMKKYDESIEDIRGKILNLSSKESDLEKRLVAIEKLLPALIDLYKEKRSD
ncbi:MAG: hypothetical protein ACP5I7_01350 [Sulfolobales archaeon]